MTNGCLGKDPRTRVDECFNSLLGRKGSLDPMVMVEGGSLGREWMLAV